MEEFVEDQNPEITAYKCLAEFRKPLLEDIISHISINRNSKGLDAGCSIGTVTRLLSGYGNVTGLDLSEDFINYAVKYNKTENTNFITGDINKLPFTQNTFDWIWSADTVWPGPKELGCPASEPLNILNGFNMILKPGGSVFLLFWSSQKLLPGYPLLEASLNTYPSATAPFDRGMNPKNHIFNFGYWLNKAGFKNIDIKTFIMDIKVPLKNNDKNALDLLFRMFWGESKSRMSRDDLEGYNKICIPDSENYILKNENYYGFLTYTLFTGTKVF
jgi:SAM-dependent methyltransferase